LLPTSPTALQVFISLACNRWLWPPGWWVNTFGLLISDLHHRRVNHTNSVNFNEI
jgi:hypothetical protein